MTTGKLFSHRKGLKPFTKMTQIESMDTDLRNGLWDMLTIYYFGRIGSQSLSDVETPIRHLLTAIWHSYFKEPIDSMSDWGPSIYKSVRTYFFDCDWNEAFDLIEFIIDTYYDEANPQSKLTNKFTENCNGVLERESSAYRIVGGRFTQITSNEEIAGVEEALEVSEPLKPVHHHLSTALAFLSDRKSPDYRNSIKESISAVESLCTIVTEEKSASLGKALDVIEKQGKVALHPALKKSFDSLYGYASSAQGIRHALGLLEEPNLAFEDAKFMLVACSAFVNYLVLKASKAGIKLIAIR